MTTLYSRSAERFSPRAQVRIAPANRRVLRRLRYPIRIEWDLSPDARERRARRTCSRVQVSS